MLLPTSCPVCGRRGRAPCRRCAAELRPAPRLPPVPGVDAWWALLAYEGAGRELVARLKYRNARDVLARLAGAMAAMVDPGGVDVVTWAPTSRPRRRHRGFDQGELLARAVARRLGRPCRPLLSRLPGPPQTGRDRRARHRGPVLVARPRPAAARRVLVVDDVVTTGATLGAAARALRSAGAGAVLGLAAAYTPPGRARR